MSDCAVRVAVRVRPFNSREKKLGVDKSIIDMQGTQTVLHNPKNKDEEPKVFNFDHSFWSMDKNDSKFARQEDVFDSVGMDVLENSFNGFNACIFAYGQTGSGKTYSMMGIEEDPGLIPRLCNTLFDTIDETMKGNKNLSYKVEVSYMEIYNEKVQDLLSNKKDRKTLRVREHKILGPYVEGLSKLAVTGYSAIATLMEEGNRSRTTAATKMNEESSRSHAVFTVKVTQQLFDEATKQTGEKVSKISLVDLAGSERHGKTGTTGARLKEGANINKSLTTLGLVISALADRSNASGAAKKKKFIPYRDSVLTWLLKDNLGGNSRTVMVATLSPAADNFEETLSTLRYADRAKRIVNHAVVNEDPNARLIRELREELERLRGEVGSGGGGQASSHSDAEVEAMKQKLKETEGFIEEMTQSWEEKLKATQAILAEREKMLDDHAASFATSGDRALRIESRLPHFISLSDDPLAADITIYTFKEGMTLVGREDSEHPNDIVIWGMGTEAQQCFIEHKVEMDPEENCLVEAVYLVPIGEHCYVNSEQIYDETRLTQGNLVQLGFTNMFRFNHPTEAARMRKKISEGKLAPQQSGNGIQSVFNPGKILEDRHKEEAERLAAEAQNIEAERQRLESAARLHEIAVKERQEEAIRRQSEIEVETEKRRQQAEEERQRREKQEEENMLLRQKLAMLEQTMRAEAQRAEEERKKREEIEAAAKERMRLEEESHEKLKQELKSKAVDKEAVEQALRAENEERERLRKDMEAQLAKQEKEIQEREERAKAAAEERIRQAEAVLASEKKMHEDALKQWQEAESRIKEEVMRASEERQKREKLEVAAAENRMKMEAEQLAVERQVQEELALKVAEAELLMEAEIEQQVQLRSQLEERERLRQEEKTRMERERLAQEKAAQEAKAQALREAEADLQRQREDFQREQVKRLQAEEVAEKERVRREIEEATMEKIMKESETVQQQKVRANALAKEEWLKRVGKDTSTLEKKLEEGSKKLKEEAERRRKLEQERRAYADQVKERNDRVDHAQKMLELTKLRDKIQNESNLGDDEDKKKRRSRIDDLDIEIEKQFLELSMQETSPEKAKKHTVGRASTASSGPASPTALENNPFAEIVNNPFFVAKDAAAPVVVAAAAVPAGRKSGLASRASSDGSPFADLNPLADKVVAPQKTPPKKSLQQLSAKSTQRSKSTNPSNFSRGPATAAAAHPFGEAAHPFADLTDLPRKTMSRSTSQPVVMDPFTSRPAQQPQPPKRSSVGMARSSSGGSDGGKRGGPMLQPTPVHHTKGKLPSKGAAKSGATKAHQQKMAEFAKKIKQAQADWDQKKRSEQKVKRHLGGQDVVHK